MAVLASDVTVLEAPSAGSVMVEVPVTWETGALAVALCGTVVVIVDPETGAVAA